MVNEPHYHEDETGKLVRCYHWCRNVLFTWQFWLGQTLGFPLEHWVWIKVPPFSIFTKWSGLG